MSKTSDPADYASQKIYTCRDPYLFMDVVKTLDREASWKLKELGKTLAEGLSSTRDVIENVFIPLEHSERRYFKEYQAKIWDDGTVVLEKDYDSSNVEGNLRVRNTFEDEITLEISGNVIHDHELKQIRQEVRTNSR